eukprot:1701608-Pleurochrysis_carterae.AAC.1
MRSSSAGSLGVWSTVRRTARSPRRSTARQSPALATCIQLRAHQKRSGGSGSRGRVQSQARRAR